MGTTDEETASHTIITNRFRPEGIPVTITKYWEDGLTGEDAANRDMPEFTLSAYDENGNPVMEWNTADDPDGWVKDSDDMWTYTFINLPANYTYKVTESAYPFYQIKVGDGDYQTINTAATGDVIMTGEGENKKGEIEFTNRAETKNLKVSKVVNGNAGSAESFPFTASITGLRASTPYTVVTSPHQNEGFAYTVTVGHLANNTTDVKFSFDRYDDGKIGRIRSVSGGTVSSIFETLDYDTETYDAAYDIWINGTTTFRNAVSSMTGFTKLVLYHLDGTDAGDLANWKIDLANENGTFVEKGALSTANGDSITIDELSELNRITTETVTSTADGKLNVNFILGDGDTWEIQGLPIGAVANVDETLTGKPYKNSWSYRYTDSTGNETTVANRKTATMTSGQNTPEITCENTYTGRDFTVQKKVTGNMGSRDKKFPFETLIENLTPGQQYQAFITTDPNSTGTDRMDFAGTYKRDENGNDTKLETKMVTYTADAQGKILAKYNLSHNQYWKIKGLPTGATCETKEIVGTLTAYTFSWAYQYKDSTYNAHELAEAQFTSANHVTKGGTVNNPIITNTITEDHTDPMLICTNDRTTVVPTGLIDHLWSVLIPIAAGIAAIAFGLYMRKRNNETGEEA